MKYLLILGIRITQVSYIMLEGSNAKAVLSRSSIQIRKKKHEIYLFVFYKHLFNYSI